VVKTFGPPLDFFIGRKGYFDIPCVQIRTWLDEEDLVALYDSCDVLLCPSRGGAFELNVYEALARGLPVITVAFGGLMDYCSFHDVYLLKGSSTVKVYTNPLSLHNGYGVSADVNAFVKTLNYVLDNVEECKEVQRKKAKMFRRSWDEVIDSFLKEVNKIAV